VEVVLEVLVQVIQVQVVLAAQEVGVMEVPTTEAELQELQTLVAVEVLQVMQEA
jgi:hypothetical protein